MKEADLRSFPATIDTGDATLQGDVVLPRGARGIVLFAHGSGSSRHSPRNRFVAERLQAGGLGTLLFDLLTAAEGKIDDFKVMVRPLKAVNLLHGLMARMLEQFAPKQ